MQYLPNSSHASDTGNSRLLYIFLASMSTKTSLMYPISPAMEKYINIFLNKKIFLSFGFCICGWNRHQKLTEY